MNTMVQPPVPENIRPAAQPANPYLSRLTLDLESIAQADAIMKAQREGWRALTAREVQLCQKAIETLAGSITQRKEALFR